MTQTRKSSLIESVSNVLIGNLVFYYANKLIFGTYGVMINDLEHFKIALFFSCLSITRSYTIRRVFNKLEL